MPNIRQHTQATGLRRRAVAGLLPALILMLLASSACRVDAGYRLPEPTGEKLRLFVGASRVIDFDNQLIDVGRVIFQFLRTPCGINGPVCEVKRTVCCECFRLHLLSPVAFFQPIAGSSRRVSTYCLTVSGMLPIQSVGDYLSGNVPTQVSLAARVSSSMLSG